MWTVAAVAGEADGFGSEASWMQMEHGRGSAKLPVHSLALQRCT